MQIITELNGIKSGQTGLGKERTMLLGIRTKFMAAVCLLATSTLTSALPGESTRAAGFVDSVYDWGAWGLGIEPAAGNPQPVSGRAINVNLTTVSFRPNDNARFAPDVIPPVNTPPLKKPPIDTPPTITPPEFTPGGAPVGTGTGDLIK